MNIYSCYCPFNRRTERVRLKLIQVKFAETVPLTKTRKVKVQQNLIVVEFAETVKLLDLHFCELVSSFEVGTAWPETHTKRQAI